ncbi:MAG: hypothetical protein JWQ78_2089, partial [Sediminibacterium sp.]|nr:hypothetical protein [Sediminibacterium sp.]
MRKLTILCVALLASICSYAQSDSLLKWQVQSKKIGESLYELRATSPIPTGLYVYGNNPAADGLEQPKFVPDYENAVFPGTLSYGGTPQSINDPIFRQVNVFTGTIEIRQQVKINGFIPEKLKGIITASLGKAGEFYTSEQPFEVALEGGAAAAGDSKKIKLASVDLAHPARECGKKTDLVSNGWLTIFFLGFFGGLIALLTPCVFPMIPV